MSIEHPFGYDPEDEIIIKGSIKAPSRPIIESNPVRGGVKIRVDSLTPPSHKELTRDFPWLEFLSPVAEGIVKVLFEKEQHYRGSWQKRGGPGAMMMGARKWDRIENIVGEQGWDIFRALEANTGDVEDDIRDLVGYLLLILAEHERRKASKGKVSNDP